MRGKCEFKTCKCDKFLLNKENTRCIACNHGKCWHKNIKKKIEVSFYLIEKLLENLNIFMLGFSLQNH